MIASMLITVEENQVAEQRWLGAAGAFLEPEEGATAVEFALVATPFLALLIAIIQTMIVFFAQRSLDEVVSQASRVIQTGQAQTSGLTQSQFASWVCQRTVILFSCGNFIVNVQSSSTFASASGSAPTLTFDVNGNVTNTWSINSEIRAISWWFR